ncbi:hypothetical protein MUK42_00081 [Musa troglodytarum]|uniref:Uncharacterized protein n=1 Tax=Musa troglodytarum TaxID=320322 RepID=A0A9E7K312_9LILI|nr:hypothetical protein MUK42_00081 [Musa troglodytarum]
MTGVTLFWIQRSSPVVSHEVTVHFVDVPVVGKPQSWLREVGYRPLMAVSKCPAKTVNAQLNCSCSRAFKCSIRTASSYNTLKLSML